MIVITGATGNTGKVVALELLKAGKKVRAIVRNEEKAAALKDAGAELAVGNLEDKEFLKNSFDGAEAVYLMTPPSYTAENFYEYQKAIANNFVYALTGSTVKYAVTLSSIGAQMNEDSGVVWGLHYMENELNKLSSINFLHLRPGYFMENLFGQIGAIKMMGGTASPLKADLSFPLIATQDIAMYAAKRLAASDFSGSSFQYLLGAADLNYSEITKIIGNAIGKPELPYFETSYEDFENAIKSFGFAESGAERMSLFTRRMNEGKVLAGITRDAESTTPTTIEEFMKTFVYVYNM